MRIVLHLSIVLSLVLALAGPASAAEVEFSEVVQALDGLMTDPEAAIPPELLAKAEGIALFVDVTKVGFGFGGRRGHGVVMGRDAEGNWGPPAYFVLTGLSTGFQIGYEVMDIALLIMSQDDMRSFVTNTITLGANASVAAGPTKGGTVETDTSTELDAGVLSYARVKEGLFAGLSLKGARIKFEDEDTEALYGKAVSAEDVIIERAVPMPEAAKPVAEALGRYEAKN